MQVKHTHGIQILRYVRSRRNERQIDSHGCMNQGLIGGLPGRVSRESGNASRTREKYRAIRFRGMTDDKVYVMS